MILDLSQPKAAVAVHMPGMPIGLHYICADDAQALALADAHEQQHGMRPVLTPVVIRIDPTRF